MFTRSLPSQWRLSLTLMILFQRPLTLALSNATGTSIGLTQVGIATNCNKFTYASTGDTCDQVSGNFSISRSQLATWNPVLGPNGQNCSTQFWAQYSYCVGVSDNSDNSDNYPASEASGPDTANADASPGEASSGTATGTSPYIAGKKWTRLPSDSSPGNYVVGGINCINPSVGFYSACWQTLNMNDWLPAWYREEPPCEAGQSEVGCSVQFPDRVEAWTTTILKEYVGAPGLDSIHKFFVDWDRTITAALNQAGDLTSPIVNAIDTREGKKNNVGLNIVLSVLSAGLFLIPGIGPIAGVSAAGILAANAGLATIRAAPAVAQNLFPRRTDAPPQQNEIDIARVQNSDLTQRLQEQLQRGLGLIQGANRENVSNFLAFAGSGNFSKSNDQNDPPPSVQGLQQIGLLQNNIQRLLQAYTTFIASTTLVQTGWHAILLPGVNPLEITNTGTGYPSWAGEDPDEADLHCTEYNDVGQCSGTYWWYSQDQNSAYVLNRGEDEDSTDLLNKVLSTRWSTGKLLFEDAAVCEIRAVLSRVPSIANNSIIYTNLSDRYGFQFNGPLPGIEPEDFTVVDPSGPTYFLPFDGAGLTHLRQQETYADFFRHPTDVDLFRFTDQGVDPSCISQLDVHVATKWGDGWE
ncbi:MAG: hypothetical protein Q9180_003096 [Flavoplaca navasiana]